MLESELLTQNHDKINDNNRGFSNAVFDWLAALQPVRKQGRKSMIVAIDFVMNGNTLLSHLE